MKRRDVLKALASLPATGAITRLSFAQSQPTGVLVAVFLRGGADSLHMVAPCDDKDYVESRPSDLRVLQQGEKAGLRLPKPLSQADWRLHPACAPLLELMQSDHAQVLHACGLQSATRSHFEAQEAIESLGKSDLGGAQGWLSAYVSNQRGLGAASSGSGSVRALAGVANALNFTGELKDGLSLPWGEEGKRVLGALYQGESGKTDPLIQVSQTALKALERVDAKIPRVDGRAKSYTPSGSVKYNTESWEWVQACQSVVQLIRMDLGLQVACIDFGGWDTHEGQSWRMNNLCRQWATNMRAMFDDLSSTGQRVSFVVMSEFGRRLKSNASGGTDHGHGGALWAIDSAASTLLPKTSWPGLSIPQLDQGLDLRSTTDVKIALSHMAAKVLS